MCGHLIARYHAYSQMTLTSYVIQLFKMDKKSRYLLFLNQFLDDFSLSRQSYY